MTKLIMGMGAPGSGKTTALRPFAERYGYTYLCADDIRAELTGDPSDQTRNRDVWREMYIRLSAALARGETVVADATFADREDRQMFIRFAREHGAERVQGVYAKVPLEVTQERNNKRERVVPEYAVERAHKQLQQAEPVVEDGFDAVFDINEFQELTRAEMQQDGAILSREWKRGGKC